MHLQAMRTILPEHKFQFQWTKANYNCQDAYGILQNENIWRFYIINKNRKKKYEYVRNDRSILFISIVERS